MHFFLKRRLINRAKLTLRFPYPDGLTLEYRATRARWTSYQTPEEMAREKDKSTLLGTYHIVNMNIKRYFQLQTPHALSCDHRAS